MFYGVIIITNKMVKHKSKIQQKKVLSKGKDYFILYATIPYKVKDFLKAERGDVLYWVIEDGEVKVYIRND